MKTQRLERKKRVQKENPNKKGEKLQENGWSKIQPFLLVVDKIGLVGYNNFDDITSFNCQSITCDGIGGIVESWGA